MDFIPNEGLVGLVPGTASQAFFRYGNNKDLRPVFMRPGSLGVLQVIGSRRPGNWEWLISLTMAWMMKWFWRDRNVTWLLWAEAIRFCDRNKGYKMQVMLVNQQEWLISLTMAWMMKWFWIDRNVTWLLWAEAIRFCDRNKGYKMQVMLVNQQVTDSG